VSTFHSLYSCGVTETVVGLIFISTFLLHLVVWSTIVNVCCNV
jgi:hypothetical protein